MREYMKKVMLIIITISALALMTKYVYSLQKENNRLKSNQEILFAENNMIIAESQKYKISNGLNAVKISELELTLKEYKRYRSEDLQLIEQLKTKKSDLQKIITSQAETIDALSLKLRDSILINATTNQIDTLKYFDYRSKWTDVSGYINLEQDSVNLQINNRESLKIVETVTYKRFLGFLWKTKKIKNRQVNIVSENPNTEIINCEYISIKP